MKQSTKQILSNIYPFIIYCISVLVYVILGLSEFVSFYVSAGCAIVVYIILSILYGYFTDFSKGKYGLFVYVAMLTVFPFLSLIEFLFRFAIWGNMFYSTLYPFETPNFVPQFIFGMIVPLLPIAIGLCLRKVIKSRKAM